MLDGGISKHSKNTLCRLVERYGKVVRLQFVAVDESLFRDATLGPAESHMAYCRTLLPRLLDVPRLIYPDCDLFVFRDLSELFDLELAPGKILAAVPDSETLTLSDDSRTLSSAMNLPADGRYFNAGVMLLNLDELRKENFTNRSLEFLVTGRGIIGFGISQPSIFFFMDELTNCPNIGIERPGALTSRRTTISSACSITRVQCRGLVGYLAQPKHYLNDLQPMWVSLSTGVHLYSKNHGGNSFVRNMLAPVRALAFPLVSLLYRIAGKEKWRGIRRRRGIGSIIFAMRRAGDSFIVGAPGKFEDEVQLRRFQAIMRVLHLNTHPSGGSYGSAALLSSALTERGIDSGVLCKNSPAEGGRFFLIG